LTQLIVSFNENLLESPLDTCFIYVIWTIWLSL